MILSLIRVRLGCLLALFIVIFPLVMSNRSASAQADPPGTMTIHVVQRDEDLTVIAQEYGTTVAAIVQANNLLNASEINIGQRLLIPNATPGVPGIPTPYIFQATDTLQSLSLRYGVDVAAIVQLNKIVSPSQLYIGENLMIQQGANNQPPIKTGWVYTVQPSDNIYRIALHYGVSVALLNKVNDLTGLPVLFPGQPLIIPGPSNAPAIADLPEHFTQLTVNPAPPEQGRTMVVIVKTDTPSKITGTFMGVQLVDIPDKTRLSHTIIFGIDAFSEPDIYTLALDATDDEGGVAHFSRLIQVADGGYSSEQITLPPDQLDLLDPKVTQPEIDMILNIVRNVTPVRYFTGTMGLPCPAPVTSQFGTRRSYDGGPYNQFHTGTDFAAVPGAPIYAPAAGTVVLTDSLHVRGNATIIDHGWGVYTGYWHQSEIDVKVGDHVQAGEIIGLVGETGRATGPHLHWEMFVNAVQVDPIQWTQQAVP